MCVSKTKIGWYIFMFSHFVSLTLSELTKEKQAQGIGQKQQKSVKQLQHQATGEKWMVLNVHFLCYLNMAIS